MQPQTSIYALVRSALDGEGRLPEDFSLPGIDHGSMLRLEAGAGPRYRENQYRDLDGEVRDVIRLLERLWKKNTVKREEKLVMYLRGRQVHELAAPLVQAVRDYKSLFTADGIHPLITAFVSESASVDLVQLGMCLSVLVDAENDPVLRRAIPTLGLAEELTRYAVWAVSGWRNGPALVRELAEKAAGQGYYHAVAGMEAAGEDRDWIIGRGCEHPRFALLCAEKGDLAGLLERDSLPDNLLRGAASILSSLSAREEEPCMDDYAPAERALTRLLHHADGSGDLDVLECVLILGEWLEDGGLPGGERLRARCREIAAKPHWEELVRLAAAEGARDRVFLAARLAQRLRLDIAEQIWDFVEQDPPERSFITPFLTDDERYAGRVFRLYEKSLDLNGIASGMGDELGEDERFAQHMALALILSGLGGYPGQGTALVRAGLRSPVVRCRTAAVGVLESWMADRDDLGEYDPELPEVLREVCEQEVVDPLRDREQHLLGRLGMDEWLY